ncbi:MAG: hypoxanthine phosphoribosyltransferase [Lentisphaeria bacterium]|nr:hypoxanthine phosphoribosyltransferase [Lentisphaeria bacterium]
METLFAQEEVRCRIGELGAEITGFYRGMNLTIVVLMNGGAFFGCDLARAVDLPLWFDSLRASSYIHDCRSGKVNLTGGLKLPVAKRHILLVDDVFDSGETIRTCKEYLLAAGALSVKSAVLVNKEVAGRKSEPDWACFTAPDRYLVGFGLDSEELYRNIPFVGCMD